MRILALTSQYPNPYQPHKTPFNRHQFRLLADRHKVAMIAPIAWTDEFRARAKGLPALPPGRRVELDGIAVDHPRYLFPPRVLQATYGPFFASSVAPTFRRAVARFRPDLIYAAWAYPDGWAAVRLARRTGIPVVIQVLGSDVLVLTTHPRRRRLTFNGLRAADGVVAVSQDLAQRVIKGGVNPDKVRVVYGGIDPSLFHPGPKHEARERVGINSERGPLILFVGNLVPVKGIGTLLRACRLLEQEGVAFQCRLIGQGPLAGRLQERINRTGLGARVELLGVKSQAELPDWYRAADVFVLPSRSEGVPNVLLEASACGTPCVASRVGGIPEITHRGSIQLVPPDDPLALARAIRETLSGCQGSFPDTPRTKSEAVDDIERFLDEVLVRHRTPHASPHLIDPARVDSAVTQLPSE